MHVKMQQHQASWNKRICSPGYRGTLPKAVRSTRVQRRDKWQIKQKKTVNDWSIFELLATVAAEILQEKVINEGNVSNQIGPGSFNKRTKFLDNSICDQDKEPSEEENKNALYGNSPIKAGEDIGDFQEELNHVFLSNERSDNVSSERISVPSNRQLRCTNCTAQGNMIVQDTSSPHISSLSSGEILTCEKPSENRTKMICGDKHFGIETGSWSLNGLAEGEIIEAAAEWKYLQTEANIYENYCDVMKCISQDSEIQSQSKRKRSISESSEVCTVEGHSNSGKFHDMHVLPHLAFYKEPSSVRVGITSFMVPELSISLPQTATVANLKRAVMDAAINLLKSGLHVRVIHQGEKVADENATLAQMGVTCEESFDSLAFMLEPNNPDSVVNFKDSLSLVTNVAGQPWYTLNGNLKGSSRNHELDTSTEIRDQTAVSKNHATLDPHQSPNEQVISHGDLRDQKAMELVVAEQHFQETPSAVKRRTRRPFTVIEVAALVKAVELLGTGRWREVKQHAFDHANHRTYVDLKDKWKTLVHTAHIAPHQRRGEPLPQELLDRVLQVHTYWSAQVKQQEGLST